MCRGAHGPGGTVFAWLEGEWLGICGNSQLEDKMYIVYGRVVCLQLQLRLRLRLQLRLQGYGGMEDEGDQDQSCSHWPKRHGGGG